MSFFPLFSDVEDGNAREEKEGAATLDYFPALSDREVRPPTVHILINDYTNDSLLT